MVVSRVLLTPFLFLYNPFVSEDSCPLRHDIAIYIGHGAISHKTGIFTNTTVSNLDILFELISFRLSCNVVLFEKLQLLLFTD